MAPRKSKAKAQVEEVAVLAKGWKQCKMTEFEVLELENNKILQSRAVIQWRHAEEKDHPYEGTHEVVLFHDFVEHGLAVPVSDFFQALLRFWGIQLHQLTP